MSNLFQARSYLNLIAKWQCLDRIRKQLDGVEEIRLIIDHARPL